MNKSMRVPYDSALVKGACLRYSSLYVIKSGGYMYYKRLLIFMVTLLLLLISCSSRAEETPGATATATDIPATIPPLRTNTPLPTLVISGSTTSTATPEATPATTSLLQTEVDVQTFFVDIPRPEDADVFMESDVLLLFSTSESVETMQTLYIDYLEADGWLRGERTQTEEQGVLFDTIQFTKPGLMAAFSVGGEGVTIVSIAIGQE